MQNKLLLFYKRYYKTAFDVGLIAFTIYLIMWVGSYVYHLALPILLALPIVAVVRPFARFLHRKGMKKTAATNVAMFSFILIIVGTFFAAGAIFVSQIYQLSQNIPDYIEFFKSGVLGKAHLFEDQIKQLPPEVITKSKEYIEVFSEKISSILSTGFKGLIVFLTSISTLIANFIVAIVLAYFLSIEMDDWNTIARQKTPKTFKQIYVFLRDNVFTGIGKYLKAQFKLISITFFIILIGLLIIGADNAFSLALLSALFDILPLLGVPAIFIPWIIYSFVAGKTGFAISLTVILLVAMITRQIAEPKIAGDALGVSPFLMLASMVVFMKIFGISGVILTPILLILIKQLYDKGYFKQWVRKPEGEYDNSK